MATNHFTPGWWLGRPVLAVAIFVTAAWPALAGDIEVTNASFEDPVVTTIPGYLNSTAGPFCFADACPTIPGWTFAALGGLFRPNGSVFPPAAVDGAQVFFSDGRSDGEAIATQSFAATVYAPATDYALTVAIGNRAEGFIVFGGGFVTMFAGTDPSHVVATVDLSTVDEPLPGQFRDVTLAVSAADILAAGAIGETIGIRLGGATQGQSIFDNVRLSTAPIPEPGTVALFALGLSGLGVALRRRRRACRSSLPGPAAAA